jgi:dihydrofolate synthase/folylpolyglutamate synthase
MTYPQVRKYLYSFINYENLHKYSYKKSFKLDRFIDFLKILGDPQSNLKVIHVAGSKGKGSVCVFIANILQQANFKVGLYTSPHLVDFRERIRILQKPEVRSQPALAIRAGRPGRPEEFAGMISKKDICRLVRNLKPRIEKFNKNLKYGALTFFEVYTAMALQYFKERRVDFVVLETGLGGRLDATNACRAILSIITPISLEHTYLLGKNLKQIAYEKASIIKEENQRTNDARVIALTSKQDRAVSGIIENICRLNNAALLKEGRDFGYHKNNNGCFDYQGLHGGFSNLRINLSGSHQIANAALAIASVEALSYHSIDIDSAAIRAGLKSCVWPARFEIVSRNPVIILDGAQNSASVKVLRKTLKEKFPQRRVWLIFGIARDKELKDTCRVIESISRNIILTKSNNPRASEPRELLKYFKSKTAYTTKSLKSALGLARSISQRRDLVLITGSLYLCGEAKVLLG